MRRRSTGRFVAMGCALVASSVSAAARAERVAPARTEGRRAEFRADRVVLATGNATIELDGHVVVEADRYRLTSEHLRLSRGPRGVVVEGSGRVALCPCPDPPITFGFTSATVAPPTDLLLAGPTVRAFGVPVFWLPYLWLRAPTRVGVLPLRLAYRGSDGPFLGSGVHVPLGASSVVDVAAGGYVLGGAEVEARARTARTTTAVRWDYFGQSLVQADLAGYSERPGGGSVAYSLDALRGPRSLSGPGALEDVSLRRDRGRLFAGAASGGGAVGLLLRAEATRGGGLGAVDGVGPGAYAAFGGGLGDFGLWDAGVATTTYRLMNGTSATLVAPHAELGASGVVGPLSLGADVRARGTTLVDAFADPAHVAVGAASVSAELPVVRSFGEARAMQHWIVPNVTGALGLSESTGGSWLASPFHDGAWRMVAGGLRSTLGEVDGRRAAGTVSARIAAIGQDDDSLRRLVVLHAAVSTPFVSLTTDGAAALGDRASDSLLGVLRVGAEDGPFIGGHVEGLRGTPLPVARFVERGIDAPFRPWTAEEGWSAGSRIGIPWTRFLATRADADFDLTRQVLLSVRGAVTYRHPCGCLALALWAAHRLGRGAASTGDGSSSVPSLASIDSFVTLDLMPTPSPLVAQAR